MSQFSVQLNFVYERFLSIFFLVSSFFGKGFYSVFFLILVLYDQVDRGEVSLSDFFDRFKELMEASLVDSGFEKVSPVNKFFFFITEELELVSKTFELEAKGVEGFFFLFSGMFEEEFKDDIKVEGHFVMESFFRLNKIKSVHEVGR